THRSPTDRPTGRTGAPEPVCVGARRRHIFALFAGHDPAAFDVAAIETVGREPLAVDVDVIILALDKEIAPAGGAFDTVDDGILQRIGGVAERAGAEDHRRVDPQFRAVGQGYGAN